MTFNCFICQDQRWVCENHDDMPWGDDHECCGGAGAPCPACNPYTRDLPPAMPPGTTLIWGTESLEDKPQ